MKRAATWACRPSTRPFRPVRGQCPPTKTPCATLPICLNDLRLQIAFSSQRQINGSCFWYGAFRDCPIVTWSQDSGPMPAAGLFSSADPLPCRVPWSHAPTNPSPLPPRSLRLGVMGYPMAAPALAGHQARSTTAPNQGPSLVQRVCPHSAPLRHAPTLPPCRGRGREIVFLAVQ